MKKVGIGVSVILTACLLITYPATAQVLPGSRVEFIIPPPPMQGVRQVQAVLHRGDGLEYIATAAPNSDSCVILRFTDIAPGEWTASVFATGEGGKMLYLARQTIQVQVGQDREEHVRLEQFQEGRTVVVASWEGTPVYLSDLTPSQSRNIMGGVGRDATYWGQPIILNGVRYAKAVVTHPDVEPGFVEYVLDGHYSRFMARAAILDDALEGGLDDGNATFSVEVDGRRIYTQVLEVRGRQWEDIDLDIKGGRVLRLCIDNANGTTWSDHAAWLEARVF